MISPEAVVEVDGDRNLRAKNDPPAANGPDDALGGGGELAVELAVEGGDGVGGLTLSCGGMNKEPEIGCLWADEPRGLPFFSLSSRAGAGVFSKRIEDVRESIRVLPRGAMNECLSPVEVAVALLLPPLGCGTERSPCGWMGLKT